MTTTPEAKRDLVTLLRETDRKQIERRLEEIDAEAAALRTLLRAIKARQRVQEVRRDA